MEQHRPWFRTKHGTHRRAQWHWTVFITVRSGPLVASKKGSIYISPHTPGLWVDKFGEFMVSRKLFGPLKLRWKLHYLPSSIKAIVFLSTPVGLTIICRRKSVIDCGHNTKMDVVSYLVHLFEDDPVVWFLKVLKTSVGIRELFPY